MEKYKVGIYWYIDNCFFPIMQNSGESEISSITGKIDSDFSHRTCWDVLFQTSGNVDYATFPRGRVMYDLKEKRYVFYSDVCIPNNVLSDYAKENNMIPFIIARDDHYRCERCMSDPKAI